MSDSGKYTLLAGVLVIAAAAVYDCMISPHIGYLRAMQRLEPAMDQLCGELGTICSTLDERLVRLRSMRRELAENRKRCFTYDECRQFMHDLQDRVEKAGCALVEANFKQDDPGAASANTTAVVQSFPVLLTVVGQYEEMIALFQWFREGHQKVCVDSYRMDLLDSAQGQMDLQVNLTIHAALQPDELQRMQGEGKEAEPEPRDATRRAPSIENATQ